MGRQTMQINSASAPILDLDTIFSIAAVGVGKISPWRRNVKNCKCASCKTALKPGEGSRFSKARFGDKEHGYSGYLCGECVANFLSHIEKWHWNRFFFLLHPAMEHTPTISGPTLAKTWKRGGLTELAHFLKAA